MSILSAFKKTNGQGAAADYTPSTTPATSNPKVLKFVEEAKALFKPESVVWCDGSKAEYQALIKSLVDGGTALWLNPEKRPNSILVRSDPPTSPASRTRPTSAPTTRTTPARPTTGSTRPR